MWQRNNRQIGDCRTILWSLLSVVVLSSSHVREARAFMVPSAIPLQPVLRHVSGRNVVSVLSTASNAAEKGNTTDLGNRWSGSGRWENEDPSEGGASHHPLAVTVPGGSTSRHPSSAPGSGSSNPYKNFGGDDNQYLLQEKYGTYFKVPNPATLMTKIICTIGPATFDDEVVIGRMLDAGMTAARINMSHGDYETAGAVIDRIRRVAEKRRKLCPIILDTKGPEIRVSALLQTGSTEQVAEMELRSGEPLTLLTGKYSPPTLDDEQTEGGDVVDSETLLQSSLTTTNRVVVTYPHLSKAVRKGDVVLLDDGRISLFVVKIDDEHAVKTQVIEGGVLKRNKGVNLPGCPVDLPHLTAKDEKDILFGVSKQVEYIAHSFTRSATGINQVRELPGVVENGISIIAKIESQEGLDNFASILKVSDGIMVARGDLGVEIPLERVCSVQKRLVSSCNAVGKPVIVATELLDSMISSPRPTRAEASDVANAVFDGADCVMLSGETAVGKYPVEAIQVMTRICKEAEIDVSSSLRAMSATGIDGGVGGVDPRRWVGGLSVPGVTDAVANKGEGVALRDAFAKSAIVTARETGADLILAISRTGLTANALAKFFSSVPVMVLSTSKQVCAQVLLHRSVTPYHVHNLDREGCLPRAIAKATELGLVGPGSRVLLLTGKDDLIANRLETFVVGEAVLPPLAELPVPPHDYYNQDDTNLQP